MLRSKEKADYFEIRLDSIRAGEALPFDLHLYFSKNAHMVIWRSQGECPTFDFLESFRQKGVERIWLHNDDRGLYERYLRATVPAETREIQDILRAPGLEPKQKQILVAHVAQKIAHRTLAQGAPPQIAHDTVERLLDETFDQRPSEVQAIWKMSRTDPFIRHGRNVATFSVIFAMGFGRIEEDLLGDIALAGLLHDVGFAYLPASLQRSPVKSLHGTALARYQTHVQLGLKLAGHFSKAVPARAGVLMGAHHEKFDGTGFPRRIEGFALDDIGQLISMADWIDSLRSGAWDGVPRTLKEAIADLEKMEKRKRNFPELFNPDLFQMVMEWAKSPPALEAAQAAVDRVQSQSRKLVA